MRSYHIIDLSEVSRTITIGRNAASNIFIRDPTVDLTNAYLTKENGQILLQDNDS